MPLVFDDEVSAPPSGRLVFDDEQPGSADFQSAQSAPSQPEAGDPRQTPLETGARAAAQAPGQTVMNAYSGLGRAAQTAADTLRQKLPGPMGPIAGNLAEFYSYIPRHLGPLAKDIANESERVYAPDRALNPKAATVGAAIGQALPMAASAIVAGPSGPLALGAGQGMDQGLDQAEEMGITDPARKLALGAAYAGIEAGVERLGGFGSKAFTAPAKRTLMEMAKAGGKTVLSEGVEEPITGALQDTSAVALAPPSYDSTELRPFVMSPMGVPVPNQSYFDRRGLETLGGLAGGAVGAGVQTLANRSAPPPAEPAAPTSDPLAAFASTMPEGSADTPVRSDATEAGMSARAPVNAPSVESGMFDAPAMEGDILRDFNVQTAAPSAGRLVFDDEAGNQIDLNPPRQNQVSPSNVEIASVTPQASPVTTPAAQAEAPVVPTTDAGSSPAAGSNLSPPAVLDAGRAPSEESGGAAQSPSTYSGPHFGGGAPARTRQVPVIPDAPYGGRDVLDFVNDNNIAVPQAILDVIQQKKNARLAPQSKGDFNWLEKYEVPKGFRKYLFSGHDDTRSNINEVAQMAHDEGLISDPTPDALMGKILETIDAREGYTRDVDAREKQLAAEEKALIAREKAEAKRQQSWADEVINGSMETPFIGIDPKLMAAYTVKGAQLIKEGFTTFAKWSREMISRFGEKVRDYLQGAWQAALKTSERGSIGGDPLDNRATGERMASDSGAAQNANEPSPGGLSRAEVDADIVSKLPDVPPGRFALVKITGLGSKRGIDVIKHPSGGFVAIVPESSLRWGSWGRTKFRAFQKAAWPFDENIFVRVSDNIDDWKHIKSGTHRGSINHATGEAENGLSVSHAPEIPAKYGYLVTGQVIGEGADGEPLLDPKTAKIVGSSKLYEATDAKIKEAQKARGLDADQIYQIAYSTPIAEIEIKSADFTQPSVKPNLNPTGAEDRATGFKNLDTSGTTAGFLNADIINEGASLISQGVRDFAAWSKAMVQKFGAAIRDYLQGVWQAAMKTSEQGFVGGDPIKLTHAAERARMAAEGKAPLPTGGQGTVDEWQAEAAARVQQPGAAAAVASEILAQQRPATPVEHYMLMNYAAALDADLAQANETLADPAAAPDARAAAAARKTTQDAERDRVAVAQQIAGSKAGAALGARSRGLDRGAAPSLAQMVADITLIQDPTGRTPLPPEERAVIEKTHEKMVEAEQAMEKQREEGKGGAQETFNTELQRLLDEAKAEIAEHQAIIETQREILKDKGAPVKLYTKSKAKLQEWSEAGDAAMQRLRDKGFFAQANMGVDVSVIGDLAEVLRGWMSKGVLNTASLTAKLMTTMGERNFMQVKKFLPQIFDKADQLAREGAKKKTPEEILAKGRKAAAANEGKLPRSLARQLALAHIVDHIERKDKTLSAAKIADLVRADLEEFQPGITTREARDLISGYGQATFPSKDEARAELRNLAAQMQKITQLEALRNKERLLKSGPQRDKPSAELRELQKQVEELKKEIGYEARSKEDELKSARDRIKTHLENQIEELQRVLAGKARPTNPREAVVYDAELNALKDLRGSLRDLVAEMPEHKLASEARRNKAALKSAQKSEAEWNRRAKAMQWKRPGKPPAAVSAEVDAARAKAKEARANFEALKKAADPRNDPEAKALRDFKRRTQKSIDDINQKIRDGAFDPPKKTPRQIKHDEESNKLKHALDQKKKEWIDLKFEHEWKTMGGTDKTIELARRTFHLGRSILTGGDLSGLLRQGGKKLFAHPIRLLGTDAPAMMRAFFSPEGETAVLDSILMRPNAISGRYKTAELKIHNPTNYSAAIAEGNARSEWLSKMAGTQRRGLKQLAIPLRFINATGRAYTTLANHMRADWFDMMVDKIETAEKRTLTDRELQSIGEMVNDFTGSGKLGFGKWEVKNSGAKDALSFVLFSPGFLMSNVRTITGASLLGGSKATRKAIATEYLRTAAGGAAWLSLAAMISAALWDRPEDWEEFFDSRSSKFLKVPVGERSAVDLMSGLSQIAVMFRRWWSEQMVSNGKLTDLTPGEGRYGQNDMKDIVNQFLRSKMSPEASFWYQRATGADFQGKPTTLLKDARQFMVPITSTQMVDAFRYEKPAEAAALSAATFLGAGVNTYKPRQ